MIHLMGYGVRILTIVISLSIHLEDSFGTQEELRGKLLIFSIYDARRKLQGASNAAAAGGATVEGGVGTAKVPTLKEEDLKALKDGIANLASTATQFAELSKVAQTGVKLNEKLAAAEVATEAYANATAGLAQSYAQISGDMNSVADETKAYKSSVEEVGKKSTSCEWCCC